MRSVVEIYQGVVTLSLRRWPGGANKANLNLRHSSSDQSCAKKLPENVNEAHKYPIRLSTRRAELPIILGFVHFQMSLRGEDASSVFSGMCRVITVGL